MEALFASRLGGAIADHKSLDADRALQESSEPERIFFTHSGLLHNIYYIFYWPEARAIGSGNMMHRVGQGILRPKLPPAQSK